MNARIFARGTRLIYRRGQERRRLDFQPRPARCRAMAFYRSLRSPLRAHSHCQVRAFLVGGYSSLRLKTTAVRRGDRLRPPLATTLRNFPRSLRVCYGLHSLRLQTAFDGYTLAIADTSGCACGVASLPFRCQLATSVCPSDLSMPLSLHSDLHSRIAILRHCASHPQEQSRLHSTPPGIDPAPRPDGRCADALTPLRQRWRPLHSLRAASGSRHGGVGKLSNRERILEIACRSTGCATPLCAVCSKLPALHRPRSPPLCATSSSPPIANATPKGREVAVVLNLASAKFLTHGSDFTAQWRGGSAYSEGAREGEGKTSVSAVGGVQSHYGGKPP